MGLMRHGGTRHERWIALVVYWTSASAFQTHPISLHCCSRGRAPLACAADPVPFSNGEQLGVLDESTVPPPLPSDSVSSIRASGLLDALEFWLRDQTIEDVLPRSQAKALILDLRDDRRFWAQQRRQFAVVWVSIEQSMRVETRPLSVVLGNETSRRLVDSLVEMEDDPALINAVLRSEIVEQLLGRILYDGIFEFVQKADLLGNIFNQLPVLGAIRMQMVAAARTQLDTILGAQLTRFLGEYTAAATESAAVYLLSEETLEPRKRAKRVAAEKLLSKPIAELVVISDVEMALARDAVWSAVREFRCAPPSTPQRSRLRSPCCARIAAQGPAGGGRLRCVPFDSAARPCPRPCPGPRSASRVGPRRSALRRVRSPAV